MVGLLGIISFKIQMLIVPQSWLCYVVKTTKMLMSKMTPKPIKSNINTNMKKLINN